MSERIYSDDFELWVKASVGLQVTKAGLHDFVRREMQTLIAQFSSDADHFTRFLESVMNENRVICRYKQRHTTETIWTYFPDCDSNKCAVCENMFDKVLEIHRRKSSKRINWIVHDTEGIKPSIHWWIVAKFYIREINDKIKGSTGPNEVDVLALLELLVHCELFENIKCLASEMIEVRNTLMHNASNEISRTEMIESFRKMKALLGEEHVKKTSGDQLRILVEKWYANQDRSSQKEEIRKLKEHIKKQRGEIQTQRDLEQQRESFVMKYGQESNEIKRTEENMLGRTTVIHFGASLSEMKKTLQDARSADETFKLRLVFPLRSMRHTLTSDVIDVLTDHACTLHNDGKSQTISLENVSFGHHTLNYAFSTDVLVKAKSSETENYSQRLTCLNLLASSLEPLILDQSDVLAETDQFKKHVMLEFICYSLAKSHGNIAEAYPSGTDDNILLIALTNEASLPTDIESFRGFKVLLKPYFAKSSESISAENYAQEKGLHCPSCPDFKSLNEVVESQTDTLLRRHSNLEGIGSSMVKSTRKGYFSEAPCVVLYCRCKSYIPYGELRFPEFLVHPNGISFKTDVREGYFQLGPNGKNLKGAAEDWHKELAMGCSVGPKQGHYDATLGPFLNAAGIDETCFLTVRHMFQPFDIADRRLKGTTIMQQADGDVRPDPYGQASKRGQEVDRECGEVLISTFNEFVDAAVVKIKPNRSPSRGFFVVPTKNELTFAGFSSTRFPTFDEGSTKDAKSMTTENFATERVIKFGKSTGLTKGSLELNGMAVRISDEESLAIQYNGKLGRKHMKNQIKINSHSLKTFFQVGDSGSAVFVVDKQDKLHCIGMAIGSMSDLSCVVTPIQTILLELEKQLGRKIVLKKFEFEAME